MPSTLSDMIESYLLKMMREASATMLEISRRRLADRFQCAPSQINYVLETRFTPERGFVVRSRRGGGGCILISQVSCDDHSELVRGLYSQARRGVTGAQARDMVRLLRGRRVISEREARLMGAALAAVGENGSVEEARFTRAQVMQSLLAALLT